MTSGRKAPRDAHEQLLTLLNGWDPAGRLASGAARTIYQPLVDPLLDLLSRNASSGDLTAFLERELQERYRHDARGAEQFAKKMLMWFEMESRETS